MYSILLVYERGEEVTKTESSLMKPDEISFQCSIHGPICMNIKEYTLKRKICFVKKMVRDRIFYFLIQRTQIYKGKWKF
jgi:hypothetical protein